jgi:hypothetical protein
MLSSFKNQDHCTREIITYNYNCLKILEFPKTYSFNLCVIEFRLFDLKRFTLYPKTFQLNSYPANVENRVSS